MRYPFSPQLIRSSHKTKALHYSYRKATKAWVARWCCFQSQTKEQLTSKPDFILASLLSSVHFRCWDLWQVHMPCLTTDPYSIEGQMLLPRRRNCSSLLCVSNPIRAPHFALSSLLLHAAMCLDAYAQLAETLWIFSINSAWAGAKLLFVGICCNFCLCPPKTVEFPVKSVREPML